MKKEFGYVQDREGNAVAGAEVYIRKQADNTLATLYSDDGSTTTANPLTTDNDGEWSAYWEDGVYKIQVYVEGVQQQEVNNVQHFDIDGFTAYGISLVSSASAATAATALGLGTGDSPQFTAVNLGHASDTTVARASAGDIQVEGNRIFRVGGADVPVADGGTGASDASGARTNLGLAIGTNVQAFDQQLSDLAGLSYTGNALKQIRVKSDETGLELATPSGGTGNSIVGSFAKWATAKARGASNPARFAIIGDSHVMGQGSSSGTNGLTNAFTTSMSRLIATDLGFQHDSLIGDQNPSAASVSATTYDSRLLLGTGWAVDSGRSILGGRLFVGSAGAAGALRFTPANAFDSFVLWHPRNTGSNTAVTVSVDGVLTDTFSQAGAAALLSRSYSVTSGTHYIEIGAGVTGTAYLSAIEIRNGTDDPIMIQGGDNGCLATHLASTSFAWSSLNQLVAMAPDYCVIYCTINDAAVPTALNAYYASIESIVASLDPTCDGCLMVGFPASTNAVTTDYYNQQMRALQNIALDYGWSFYDAREAVGRSYTKANAAGFAYDTFHANPTGFAAIKDGLLDVIGPHL